MYCIALLSDAGSFRDGHTKHGLAHVCEHSVLFHHMYKHRNHSPLTISGRTDFHNCSILFSMPEEYVAYEGASMIEDIISGAYLTEHSLESAKEEVLAECLKRKRYDKKMEQIISFVTDGIIDTMPTGKVSDIQALTLMDVHKGDPFCHSNSLIFLEYGGSRIGTPFLFMPTPESIEVIKEHAPSMKLLATPDEGIRIYLAMPSCVTYEDILLRAMLESVIRQRTYELHMQIKGVYHKHYFKEFPHLILAFRHSELPTEDSVYKLISLLSNPHITKAEFRHASSMILANAENAPLPEVLKEMQCYLSFGTPSMSQLDFKEIETLVGTVSKEKLSEYIRCSFTNVHIVFGT